MSVDSLLAMMSAEKYGDSAPSSDANASSSDSESDASDSEPEYDLPSDSTIWNSSVTIAQRWLQSTPITSHHHRAPPKPTQASDEVWRFKSMTFLRNKFDKSCNDIDGLSSPPPQAFERWVFNCDLRLNSLPSWNVDADTALCIELKQAGAHTKAANGIAQQMKRNANRANHTLNNAIGASTKRQVIMSIIEREVKTEARSSNKSSSSSSSSSATSTSTSTTTAPVVHHPMVRLTYGKTKVHLTLDHFAKLLEMYRLNNHDSIEPTAPPPSYTNTNNSKKRPRSHSNDADDQGAPQPHELDAIFTVVLRYNTLVGPQTQGAGFQAALNGECFDVLLKHWGAQMECFASPLNSRYRTFCSAYADTDRLFGSQGSFFHFHPLRGSFEANPPFVGHVMLKMVTHMLALLERATSHAEALQFIVVIPCWNDDAAHQRLEHRCLPHMRHHLVVSQRNHGYTEGAQWDKVDSRFRISTCDTSVFFLQTPKAASKWTVTTEKLNELRTSFRSKHRGEESGASDGAAAVLGDDTGEGGGGGARTKERKRYQDNAEIQRQRREALHQTQVDPFKSKKKHKKN